MTLALPGRIWTVVIPAFTAASSPPSSALALMASSALMWGVAGSVASLPSPPAQPIFSSMMPMWQWASMRPGITTFPVTSMTSASSGTLILLPTLTIFPPSMRMVPPSMTPSVMVKIFPPLMANKHYTEVTSTDENIRFATARGLPRIDYPLMDEPSTRFPLLGRIS